MRIAVIGGGIQGIGVALEFALRGVRVDLLERNPALMQGASRHNEGKLHLGYVYANDPGLKTARLMSRGAFAFSRAMERWLERDVSTIQPSSPFYYAVHRDSLLRSDELECRYSKIREFIRDDERTEGPLFGQRDVHELRRLTRSELSQSFNEECIEGAFASSEIAVDPDQIASMLVERVSADPRIEIHLNTQVRGAECRGSTIRLFLNQEGRSRTEGYSHVVNCAWCGRLAIDATMGIHPEQPWSFRRKRFVRFAKPPQGEKLPSVTMVLGAFGDVVHYANGDLFVSWYPVGCTGLERQLVPSEWNELDPEQVKSETLSVVRRIVPRLQSIDPTSGTLRSGIIFALGTTDVDDPRSKLHQRIEVGPRSYGRYHTIDTGKYTTAPLFAEQLATDFAQKGGSLMAPEIFVAVPVYRGSELAPETLRSIRNQTYSNYTVLISIDGEEDDSISACRPFTSDPRFKMVVQKERLGWPGNLNWLIEQCDCPYFCYWQQDDLAATNYLEALLEEMVRQPQAAIAYADLQWFGARFERETAPPILGGSAHRVLQHVEGICYHPLRGLMRANFLPRSEAIPVTRDESCQEEFVFLAKMAAKGEFRRVPNTMYFKRAHQANTFARWNAWPESRRRRGWIDLGLGFFDVGMQVLRGHRLQRRLLTTILDRLTLARGERGFFYKPRSESVDEITHFAWDFLHRGNLRPEPLNLSATYDDEYSGFLHAQYLTVDEALRQVESRLEVRCSIGEKMHQLDSVAFDVTDDGDGLSLLGFGWSHPEAWGVWNDGDEATLALPSLPEGIWRLSLEGHHFATDSDDSDKRIEWQLQNTETWCLELFKANQPIEIACILKVQNHVPLNVHLRFPDAVLLKNVGIDDPRQIAFGLRKISLKREFGSF